MRDGEGLERDVMWNAWTEEGLEYLKLTQDGGGVEADSVVIGVENGVPFRIRYTIRCVAGWRVRELLVSSLADDDKGFEMFADGEFRRVRRGSIRRHRRAGAELPGSVHKSESWLRLDWTCLLL